MSDFSVLIFVEAWGLLHVCLCGESVIFFLCLDRASGVDWEWLISLPKADTTCIRGSLFMDEILRIRLLGGFSLCYGGEKITAVKSARLQSLLGDLLMHRNMPQSRRRLAFTFWPDSPESQALTNLRNLLHRLRRSIPNADRFLIISGQTVQWRPDSPYSLDVADFEEAITRANRVGKMGETGMEQEALERAVSIYRGELLPGCYDDWVWPERERLRRMFLSALERLILVLEKEGNLDKAIKYAHRMIKELPMREGSYRHLMRLYALSGEKANALRLYRDLSEMLNREMGLNPAPITRDLYRIILQSGTPEDVAAALGRSIRSPNAHTLRHNLPAAPTPFIGRERELHEVLERLRDPSCRVLTLVGPGGIGKTRLAMRVGEEMVGSYPDGVFFVPLDSVASAELLVSAIANVIGIGGYMQGDLRERLKEYLRDKRMLLILDGFEQLAGESPLIGRMVAAAPYVQILVTSRERLNLQCEWVYELGGLSFPQDASGWIERYDAVQLFLQSARRVHPGFSMSEEERESVVRICNLTEGMPLGIEMAAAWVPILDCGEIAQEIEKNLDFLRLPSKDVPERHRSIRAVFHHSWKLLTDEERQAFKRMSLFRGSFCREAAEFVAGASLPVLLALASKSLLYRTPSGRYRVHQLLRQCGAEMLKEDPNDLERTVRRYVEYYADFLSSRETAMKNGNQKQVLGEIDEEWGNIWAAWKWGVERRYLSDVGRMMDGLWLFLEMRGRFVEGEEMFREAEAAVRPMENRTEAEVGVFGRILARYGWFCFRISSMEKARSLLEESLGLLRPIGAKKEIAFAVGALGVVFYVLGEYEQAERLQRESLEMCREVGDRFGTARALNSLAFVSNALGKYEEARSLLGKAISEFEALGNKWGVAFSLNNLGTTLYYLGEYERAKDAFQRSLEIRRAIDDRWGIPRSLDGLGRVSCALGDFEEARKCFQTSLKIFEESGDRRNVAYALFYLGDLAALTGEYARARDLYRQSLSIRRQVRDRRGAVRSLVGLGRVAMKLGDFEEAASRFSEALDEAKSVGSPSLVSEAKLGMAELLAEQGDAAQARAVAEEVLNNPSRSRIVEESAIALLRRVGAQ